jgi:hypothetical protein
MATTACPKCGQPRRPGARFCGNCGALVPATPSPQAAAAATSRAEENVCPHCGKPVRSGAKFCSNCGKTIEVTAVQTGLPLKAEPAASVQATAVQLPVVKPGPVAPPVAVPPAAKTPPAKAASKSGRAVWIWVSVILLIILCIAVAAAGYFAYTKNFFGLFKAATSSPTPGLTASSSVAPKATTTPPAKTTPSPMVTLTQAPLQPTGVPTTAVPTAAVSPTTGVTNTPSIPQVLFKDEFSSDLNALWSVWGEPRPKISKGPGDSWLDLAVSDLLGSDGVTSKQEVKNDSGVHITLQGQLNTTYPQFSLILDWDPIQVNRASGGQDAGIIHLEIHKDKAILKTPLTNSTCTVTLDGVEPHTYRLLIAGRGVELSVDQEASLACGSKDMGLAPTAGKVSLTGVGWVTQIEVTH